MATPTPRPAVYGLMAEFRTGNDLMAAAHAAYQDGYRRLDAYTPYPMEGLAEVIGFNERKLPKIVFAGGLAGCLGGYWLQYWISVIDYPVNIGGRPLHSWPAFVVPAFETTILFAAFATVLGMLALNGLPQPYHPVFNVPRFALASRDRFFLCIEAADPKFDLAETRQFLERFNPREVNDVEH